MRKQTNTLSPSPKGFQSPKFSDSDFREVRGLGRPKTSAINIMAQKVIYYHVYIISKKVMGVGGGVGCVWCGGGESLFCARTFQGLHFVRLWTLTILFLHYRVSRRFN
jgi:hypothetical protein